MCLGEEGNCTVWQKPGNKQKQMVKHKQGCKAGLSSVGSQERGEGLTLCRSSSSMGMMPGLMNGLTAKGPAEGRDAHKAAQAPPHLRGSR